MSLVARKTAEARAAAANAAKPESLLARARATCPRGEETAMPTLGRVWVELPGEAIVDEIEGATFAAMKLLDLPATPINMPTYESRRLALTLAWAVRDPDNHAERAGSQDEWMAMDIDLLMACGIVYSDVRERLSPVGVGQLTTEQMDEIRLAIEKKNPTRLRSYGVVVLSSYLLSTADPPASSPTTQFSTGASQ